MTFSLTHPKKVSKLQNCQVVFVFQYVSHTIHGTNGIFPYMNFFEFLWCSCRQKYTSVMDPIGMLSTAQPRSSNRWSRTKHKAEMSMSCAAAVAWNLICSTKQITSEIRPKKRNTPEFTYMTIAGKSPCFIRIHTSTHSWWMFYCHVSFHGEKNPCGFLGIQH